MSYNKHNFKKGDPLPAQSLNEMETQISENAEGLASQSQQIVELLGFTDTLCDILSEALYGTNQTTQIEALRQGLKAILNGEQPPITESITLSFSGSKAIFNGLNNTSISYIGAKAIVGGN